MRLADFIEANASRIIERATVFAETQAPAKVHLNAAALKDHFPQILAEIARDLRTSQNPAQQLAKSEGRAPAHVGPESAASSHGRTRAELGFDVNHMVAEYRALRASVLRLWAAHTALTNESIEDMIRFNEAIDQAISESLVDFSQEVESWRQVFLGVLGHDLRGPLAAIVSTSELLSQMTAGTSESVLAERIASGCMRMSQLLDNLLDYNRTQLGVGIAIDASICDLEESLRAEVDILRTALPKATINLHAQGATRGLFDASRMREALHNLVTNAAKYGNPAEEILVSLMGAPEGIQLTVSNSGGVLPADWSDSIFEPLQRGPSASIKGDRASLGLGLYVVREIVRAHGG